MVFDTACSSSLIAIHVARRSMYHKECPLALAIAPNAMLHPVDHVGRAVIAMTSVRGRCHTFDSRADGYLRGEGCGAPGAIRLPPDVPRLGLGALQNPGRGRALKRPTALPLGRPATQCMFSLFVCTRLM